MAFGDLFKRKSVPLSGAPAIRRMKTYSAQTGYVYQYHYEGYRPFRAAGESGTEFVFQISADRKEWTALAVRVSEGALRAWQEAHTREISSTERYAIAKIALFQAFDERPPAQMKNDVNVRPADLQAILETLDL